MYEWDMRNHATDEQAWAFFFPQVSHGITNECNQNMNLYLSLHLSFNV